MGAATAGAMASLFDAGGVAGGVFAGVATDALLGGLVAGRAVCRFKGCTLGRREQE